MRVYSRLWLVGFYTLAIAIVTITTTLREVREVGATRPLSWIDPATRGSTISTLGLKSWLGISRIKFGIRRFEFTSALVVR